MTELPTLAIARRASIAAPARFAARLSRPGTGGPGSDHFVELVAPDEYSAALLVMYAAPLFPAEFDEGSTRTVRLMPPPGPGAALKVRLLVECWLEAVPLPCASVIHGGRSYLIRRQPFECRLHSTAPHPLGDDGWGHLALIASDP